MKVEEAFTLAQSGQVNQVPSPDQIGPLAGSDFDQALHLSIIMKVAGRRDWASGFLGILISLFPSQPSAKYEYAILQKESKSLLDAVLHAEAAYKQSPDNFQFGILYANLLTANNAWLEAEEILKSIQPKSTSEHSELLSMKDFNNYIKENPRSKAVYITRKLRDKYYWMQSTEVARNIESAINDSRPFSLIRLGDGDGAHFSVSSEDEKKYPHLHARVRKQHTDFLLGVDNDPVFTGYSALTTTLMQHVKEADILGVPYPTWVEHEYDISSPVTLTCLMNVNRHLYENERVPGLSLCDQMIHTELHHDQLITPLMKKIKSITIISCLDGLPAKINELFGIEDIEFIKIPSETYAPHLYGERHLNISLHYPHAFWPTVQRLSTYHNGRVFLIAAGTFGKYYAAIIKRHGGIALDLGSLVDGWMKLASRPGYAEFFA